MSETLVELTLADNEVPLDDTNSPDESRRQLFSPTQQWLDRVKGAVRLQTIHVLLQYLVPKVEHWASHNAGLDQVSRALCYMVYIVLRYSLYDRVY